MYQKGRAWIELDLANLEHNVKYLKDLLSGDCKLMPAVKANAYGHGAVLIAKALQKMGITDCCVASVEEGIELRSAGIAGNILVLGYTHPRQIEQLVRYNLTQTVVDSDYAKQLSNLGKTVQVHIGIDTGMHRLGIDWKDMKSIQKIWEYQKLKVTGVFSHLCAADGTTQKEEDYTRKQIQRFENVVNQLKQEGKTGFVTHLQGSYGILNYPECRFDYARPGIALYGLFSSFAEYKEQEKEAQKKEKQKKEKQTCGMLRPVLSLKTRVESVRILEKGESAGYGMAYTAVLRRKIAVLSIGYADGIPREIAGKAYVLCRGKKAAVIGRICMDQMLVDATDIPDITSGDEVVLIGRSGKEQIPAEAYAEWTDSITNEVVSRLGLRLERICGK